MSDPPTPSINPLQQENADTVREAVTARARNRRAGSRATKPLLLLLATSTLAVGVLLIVVGALTGSTTLNDCILAFGSTLATFAFTTLLVTYFASVPLQKELISRIDDEMSKHIRDVERSMATTSGAFRDSISDFNPLVGNCIKYGLINVHLTRSDALSDFASHLMEELSLNLSRS